MSTTPINSNIYFIDDVKKAACKKISILIEKDNKSYLRVKSCLEDIGVTFLQELPVNTLKFMLKMEESWENNTIGEVLIEQ